jgi:quercetin dioxygenase-like cupin family protein
MSSTQQIRTSVNAPARLATGLMAAAVLAVAGPVAGQVPGSGIIDPVPDNHMILAPADVEWRAGPASLPAGAEFAVLEGDPSQRGFFTLRLRLPDGYVIPPHSHPGVERLTVVSGTFRLGMGDQVDPQATRALEPGSYFSMPPGMNHFAIAQGETVVQLTSIGPWQVNYANPADDPRR